MDGRSDLSTHHPCIASENVGSIGHGGGREPAKGCHGLLWRKREVEGMLWMLCKTRNRKCQCSSSILTMFARAHSMLNGHGLDRELRALSPLERHREDTRKRSTHQDGLYRVLNGVGLTRLSNPSTEKNKTMQSM